MATSLDPTEREDGARDLGPRIRSFRERFSHDPALRRTLVLILVLVIALAAGVWLLIVDLREHTEFIVHATAKAAAVLLPFIVIAIAARLPALNRRINPRFIIRPFGTTSSTSEYDGSAIAVLLYRDIVAWPVRASGGLAADSVGRIPLPPVNVTLGVTALPLDWLWSQLRHLLTGRKQVVIDGLLIDSEERVRLRVWSGKDSWEQTFDGSEPEAVGRAISNLTPSVLEFIDPVLAARIQWERWNHDHAIRLISAQDHTEAIQLEHVEILLDGGYLTSAERLLTQLQTRISATSGSTIELYRLQADVRTRRGEYEIARKLLESAVSHPQCEGSRSDAIPLLRRQLADLSVYQQDYSDTIEVYLEAFDCSIDELCRLTGEEDSDILEALLDQPLPATTSGEIVAALWTLYWICCHSAHCRLVLGDPTGALTDLERAKLVVIKLWPHDTHWPPRAPLEYAVVMKSIARIQHQGGDEEFMESAREAVLYFDEAIAQREKWLKEATDDLQAAADMAWSYLGKGSCLLLFDSRSGVDVPSGAHDRARDKQRDQLAGLLKRSFRGLGEEGRELFRAQFERAHRAHADEPAYRRRLSLAASTLMERLLLELASDDLMAVLDEIELLQIAFPESGPSVEGSNVPWLSESARQKLLQAGFREEDASQLHRATLYLLDRLMRPSAEEVREFFVATDRLIGIDESFGSCERKFVELTKNASKRTQAEGHYGLACVNAARDRIDEAERELTETGHSAGDDSLHYLHRAMLDDDLLPFRGRWSELATRVGGSSFGRPEDLG